MIFIKAKGTDASSKQLKGQAFLDPIQNERQ